eukprot:NODE_26647_length_543_cov_2.711538.p3 GENE.NODE_26647_length_543_cov_2.711538~~NODE_26647_length_543_cov_2.711538.p3  ORF type:complete len:78 (+),score=39.57 NODE_26647_length_543_cov_2.711538:299-532(+)
MSAAMRPCCREYSLVRRFACLAAMVAQQRRGVGCLADVAEIADDRQKKKKKKKKKKLCVKNNPLKKTKHPTKKKKWQ